MLWHEPIWLPLEPGDKHLLIMSLLIEAQLILKCTGLYTAQIINNNWTNNNWTTLYSTNG